VGSWKAVIGHSPRIGLPYMNSFRAANRNSALLKKMAVSFPSDLVLALMGMKVKIAR